MGRQRGATDFLAAASVLPESVGTLLGLLPDAATVSPLIVRPLQLTKAGSNPGNEFEVQLVGYDPAIGLGGPLAVAKGKSPPGPGEVVVDEETSDRYRLDIGDRLIRGARSLTVVVRSAGGDFVFTQVGFVTLETAVGFPRPNPHC